MQEKVASDARSDSELIAAINKGDEAAFEVAYYRYRDWVTRLAYRFTGDEGTALDVLQETFLYFLKKFPGFRLTSSLKTFLYPAVRNLSIAARSKAARYATDEAAQRHVEETPAPDPPRSATDDLALVLACLSEEQREVLLLRFAHGLSLQEVADALRIPLGTVKSRMHHALQTLRQDERTKEFFEQ